MKFKVYRDAFKPFPLRKIIIELRGESGELIDRQRIMCILLCRLEKKLKRRMRRMQRRAKIMLQAARDVNALRK